MKYKKSVSLGQFARKGEDIKHGDIVTVLNEGEQFEGDYGTQDVFSIKTTRGEEKNITLNKTSLNNMIDAYGEDSSGWVGKEAKIWLIMSNIQGKMKQVLYVSHPKAEIDPMTGAFSVISDSDIPIIEEQNYSEDAKNEL